VNLGSESSRNQLDVIEATDVVVCGSFLISQGGGNLTAELEDVLVSNLLKLTSASGNDDMTLDTVRAKNLTVALGRSNDAVTVVNTTVTQTASFDGGAGHDTFDDGGGNSYGKLKRTGFEAIVI
jgi:hypothetical protein